MPEIQESCKIGEKAKIADSCLIRSHSVVYDDVEIGDGTKTGHFVLIREKTRIGKNCTVGTGTIIDGETEIGDNVIIQSSVYIPRKTKIEDNAFLGPCCVLTNDKKPPQPDLKGPIIRKGAVIGANSTILSGVEIGENAMVGAGAVVTRDVEPNTVVTGVPAKFYCKRDELK